MSPAYAVVIQVFYRNGLLPTRKPVIVGTCYS